MDGLTRPINIIRSIELLSSGAQCSHGLPNSSLWYVSGTACGVSCRQAGTSDDRDTEGRIQTGGGQAWQDGHVE